MKAREKLILGVCLLIVVGCSSKKEEKIGIDPIPVKTIIASATTEASTRSYVGTIAESDGSSLSFASVGTVSRVLVDEGQSVAKGQILATLNKATVMNSYDIAKSALKQAQDGFRRLSGLYKKGSLTEIKYVEIQTQLAQAEASERIARKAISDCTLRAPFAGIISQRMVDPGNNVVSGIASFKLVKIDRVDVNVSVPEQEISQIKIGRTMPFTVAALNGRSFTGRVKEKGVQANPISHTYIVKLTLSNPGHALMPGMVCSIKLNEQNSETGSNAIIIPQEAVMIDDNGSSFVWVAEGSQAQRREITTGDISTQGVVITSGIKNGDEVIVSGQNKVSEGSKIQKL
jgi:RND family efflux transporter MFP subunit